MSMLEIKDRLTTSHLLELTLTQVQINILTLTRFIQPFIWETRLVKKRIPDLSIEPYPYTNGEQTRHAKVLLNHHRSVT